MTGLRCKNDQAYGTDLILILGCGSAGSMRLNSVVLGAILTLVSVTGFLLGIAPLGGVELVVAHFGAYPRDRADFCTECAVVVVFLCILTVSACACYEVCVICDLFGEAVNTKGGTGPDGSSDLITVSAIVVILLGTLTVSAGTCYEVRCIFKFFTEAVLASLGAGVELIDSIGIVLCICTANGASIPVNIVFGALGGCGLEMCSILDLLGVIVTLLSNLTVAGLPSIDIGDLNGSGGVLKILAAGALVVRLVAVIGTGSTTFGNRSQMIIANMNTIGVSGLQFNHKGNTGTCVGQDQYGITLAQSVTMIEIHGNTIGGQLFIAYHRDRVVAESDADPHGRKIESLSGFGDFGRSIKSQTGDFGNRDIPNSRFRTAGGHPSATRINVLLIIDLADQCAENSGRIDDLKGCLTVSKGFLCHNDAGLFDTPCRRHILLVAFHGVIQAEVGGGAPHIAGLAQNQIQVAAELNIIFGRVREDGCPCHADAEGDGMAVVFTDDGGDATTDSGDLTRFVNSSHQFIVAVPPDINVRAFFIETETVAEHGVPVARVQSIAVADLEIDLIFTDALHTRKGQVGIPHGYGQAVRPATQHGQTVVAQNASVHGDLHGHACEEYVIGHEAEHAGHLQTGLNIGAQSRLLDAQGGDRRIHRYQCAGEPLAAQRHGDGVVQNALGGHRMVKLDVNTAVCLNNSIQNFGIAGAGHGNIHIQMGRRHIQHDALGAGIPLALEDHLPLTIQNIPTVIAVSITGIGVGWFAVILAVPQRPGLAVLVQIIQIRLYTLHGISGCARIEVTGGVGTYVRNEELSIAMLILFLSLVLVLVLVFIRIAGICRRIGKVILVCLIQNIVDLVNTLLLHLEHSVHYAAVLGEVAAKHGCSQAHGAAGLADAAANGLGGLPALIKHFVDLLASILTGLSACSATAAGIAGADITLRILV